MYSLTTNQHEHELQIFVSFKRVNVHIVSTKSHFGSDKMDGLHFHFCFCRVEANRYIQERLEDESWAQKKKRRGETTADARWVSKSTEARDVMEVRCYFGHSGGASTDSDSDCF